MNFIRRYKKVLITLFILGIILPAGAVVFLYRLAMATELPGRRGGPQDAFRHTFSTALTARYISPHAVELVTWMCERDHTNPFDLMDIHNNAIGTRIGSGDGPLYETVMDKIKHGEVNAADENVVTWLPENEWDHGL